LYGFRKKEREGSIELETLSVLGDPHGDIRSIGSTIARGMTGHDRTVLGLSATGRFEGSPRYDVRGDLYLVRPDDDDALDVSRHTVRDEEGNIVSISGIGDKEERLEHVQKVAEQSVWELSDKLSQLEACDERGDHVLVVTQSYDEARATARRLHRESSDMSVLAVLREEGVRNTDVDAIDSKDVEDFGAKKHEVLVAPLQTVARGHNIVVPGSDRSAIGAIYVFVRPIPPVGGPGRLLAHVSYDAATRAPKGTSPGDVVRREIQRAESKRLTFQKNIRPLSQMDPEIRREVVADVLVDLAQLAGRARRGGTTSEIVFVDGAFVRDWASWLEELIDYWRERDCLEEMKTLHRSFVSGLEQYVQEQG
jgi:hypothetical protein